MSQLRKSASFRSRIPVRRAKIPNRRCSSPSPPKVSRTSAAPGPGRQPASTKAASASGGAAGVGRPKPGTVSTPGSTGAAANPFGPAASPWKTRSNRHKPLAAACDATGPRADAAPRHCYSSSSSFSSSDESYESEAPLQRLVKQLDGAEDAFYTSTDAISLDGLLESVSSGSFSSPPSPVQYQNTKMPQYHSSSYESLDKYNVALETLKLSENLPPKNKPRSATLERRAEGGHSASMSNIGLENGQPAAKGISSSIEDNTRVGHRPDLKAMRSPSAAAARCRFEAEKQRNLSDWYYIKSSPGPRPGAGCNHVMESPSSQRIAPCPLSSAPSAFPFGAMNSKLSRAFPPAPPPYSSIRRAPSGSAGGGGDSFYYKNRKRDDNLNFNTRDEFDTEKCEPDRRDDGAGCRSGDADPTRGVTQNNLNNFDIKFNLSPNKTVANDTVPFNQLHPGTVAGNDGSSGGGDGKDISGGHSGHRNNTASVGSCAEMGKHVDKHLPITSPCWRQKHTQQQDEQQQQQQQQQQQFEECQSLANNNPRRNNHLGRPRIQNRPDETSSSSFEQLNIIGVPINQEDRTDPSNLWEWSENAAAEIERKYYEARRRPLPQLPPDAEIFPPKTTTYRSDCELSGSYVSLECPSPPGPPTCLPESRRDPQARLSNYLKTLYTDLALKEPIIPQWAIPVAPGALCPAKLEPELRLHAQSHGFNDCITVDQVLTSIHTKEGSFLEAPRRVLVECPSWASRSNLSLRILHAWAKEPPWPPKGTPVALALFIPLAEIKRSFANYVEKELLPKGPLNPFSSGFGGFTAAWNSLEALGPKLLIVLDGYDNQRGSPKRKGKNYPPDVHDLLDGKLFPDARVIITTSTSNNTESLPPIQRHITYEGLTWGRSASLLGGGQWGAPTRLLDTVQECPHLRKVVRTPLGCLGVSAIYEATAGDLPTDELDVIESVLNCVAPETSSNNVAELGRLALFCLKMKRPSITVSEVRMYCSSPDSNIMGCLDKGLLLGKTSRKKGEIVYNYICPGMAEFLAANYIASLANRPGLLAAEITGLSMGDELDPELLKVITFAMGLLGSRAHVLLSKLTPLWLTPQTIFSLALAGGSSEDNLSALCDMLGISKHPPISPLETKPIWVQIRSVPTELMGWGMALKSPSCTLKNLELIYQLEKHILLDSRNAMEMFLESLAANESVCTLRISSLIETEVKESEINYLASCVSKALLKPRLENFELVLTLLEEDPPILKLQSVVTALCRAIPRQQKLSSLVLDLGLSTSQLVQLCSTLDKCPNITRLSLPHLRCERGAIGALASLLTVRPLSFLALPSCWGARDDPPSSSGVSMGSGSGSSTGTSGLIKQGSLTGVPSPRSYPPGIFSSLPRGVFVPTATMGRSATLPRQPMEPPADKRSSDSVVSKTWYPTPACDGGPHNSGTLHDLLLAAREPYSKLHGLDLSKAQLSLEDSMCLGETVRLSNTLHTLKLEGSSRLSEILPSVLGASESPCLQMLSIGSPRLSLEDSAIAMSARSLTSCSTLRLLSLDGWSFRVENPSTLSIIRAFLSLTSIRELSLANCRLQIGIFRSDTKIINAFESRSVVVLKLSGAQTILGDSVLIRGPQLLPFIGGFPCLRELDLSAPARSGFGSTISTPLILDDKCLINFFQSLHTHFSLLNTLKMCNWVIHFDDPVKTLKSLSKCIRNSPISHLKLDGISVLDRQKKLRIESSFLHCFISTLPFLRWMGISLSGKKEDQITAIGNAVMDLKGSEIDIKLSESTIEQAKLMAQAISLDGKFDIKVSTFGTSSGILIHAEKSGTKSLSRKHKD